MKDMSFEDSICNGHFGWSEMLISQDYSTEQLEDEQFLTAAIIELWSTRQRHSDEVKRERQCIRGLDSKLGQVLFQVKLRLSKPGRGGGWSAWLAKLGVSRALADRTVLRFAEYRRLHTEVL
jgi:hypothetical protein